MNYFLNSILKTKDQRVAILGGLGFIGSHLSRELLSRGYTVRIFDKIYASHELVKDIESSVEIVEGDICRPMDVLGALSDCTTVVHLIHTTVPGSSMADPAYDIASNVVASTEWLRRLAEVNICQILYVSSGGTVYGIPEKTPIDENHHTNPICSYGITKLAIEKYIAMYASMFGINYRILRPSNVYGAGQRLTIGQGVIGVMIDRALRRVPLEIWGTGESMRDYLYIDDMVSAILSLIEYGGKDCIFNVSSGNGYSVLEIISIIQKHLEFVPEIIPKPDRGFDVPVNILDYNRLLKHTGWYPKVSLEVGIKKTVDWLKELYDGKSY